MFDHIARCTEITDKGLDACLSNDRAPGKPFLIRGAVSHWPIVEAAQQSNLAVMNYLESNATTEPLVFYRGASKDKGRIFFDDQYEGFNFTRSQGPVGEILAALRAAEKSDSSQAIYVGSTLVDRWFPGIRKENNLRVPHESPLVSLWMGNESKVAAHFDCPQNMACCVAGRRQFILFPPEQVSGLYIGPLDLSPSGRPISLVDFDNPDEVAYPKFKQALKHALVADLRPGDILYIPPLWWHYVIASDAFNVLINYWWVNWPKVSLSPEVAFEQALLSIRGLPESEKMAWKALFDHYIFGSDDAVVGHIPSHIRGVLDKNNQSAQERLLQRLKERFRRLGK